MKALGMRKALTISSFIICLSTHAANASDPLPGDAMAPPSDLNIFLYYNEYAAAGALEPTHGADYPYKTHIAVEAQALRYIRTFSVQGMVAGVQIVEPYVLFTGHQEAGLEPTPYGPARASLSHGGGFAQPQLGAYIFPLSDAATGSYVVTGIWLAPPIGNYQAGKKLNFTQNLWNGELEIGAHQLLLGDRAGQNLSVELWGEQYFYGDNGHAAAVSPQVSAGGITLQAENATPARLSQQPTSEMRVYFPYQFYAPMRATLTPGFYQSFGGKQVYTLGNGTKLDSEVRTNETQVRLVISSYISPHWQMLLNTEYDLAARGGPLERAVELRVAAAF